MLWLASRCLPYDQNTSLYPLIGLLEQLLGFAVDDTPEVRREKLAGMLARYQFDHPSAAWLLTLLLGLVTGTEASETAAPKQPEPVTPAQREQMRAVFVALVQKRAAEQPLVLEIEDLHWADPSSVDWLGQSIASLASVPCLTLLTARPVFQPAWLADRAAQSHLLQLALHPLHSEPAERMIADLAGEGKLEEGLRRRIIAQTDGNPLFIEELTKTLLERLGNQGTAPANAEIPATLRDSLAARLDHLGMAKETAQWAAVLGREFSYPILQACLPYDEQRLQSDMARLIEAELVSPIQAATQDAASYITGAQGPPQLRYTFKHILVQEAAYASLLKRTRQVYHRRIAEVLEIHFPQMAEMRPELLAQHYDGAEMPTKAIDYWLRAGERATARGATLEARTFFERALQGIPPEDHERRWQALLRLDDVLVLGVEREAEKKSVEALLEQAETCDNDTRRAQAFLRQARYAARTSDSALGIRASEEAVAAARRAGNPTLEVQGLTSVLTKRSIRGEWDAANQLAEEALVKLPEVEDEKIQAYVLAGVGFHYYNLGDFYRALVFTRQSAEVARRIGNLQRVCHCNGNIGSIYALLGRYADAQPR